MSESSAGGGTEASDWGGLKARKNDEGERGLAGLPSIQYCKKNAV